MHDSSNRDMTSPPLQDQHLQLDVSLCSNDARDGDHGSATAGLQPCPRSEPDLACDKSASADGRQHNQAQTAQGLWAFSLHESLAFLLSVLLAVAGVAVIEWAIFSSKSGLTGLLSLLAVQSPLAMAIGIGLAWPYTVLKRLGARLTDLLGRRIPADAKPILARIYWGTFVGFIVLAALPYPLFNTIQGLSSGLTSNSLVRLFISSASLLALAATLLIALVGGTLVALLLPRSLTGRVPGAMTLFWSLAFPLPFLVVPVLTLMKSPFQMASAYTLLLPALVAGLIPTFQAVLRRLPSLALAIVSPLVSAAAVAVLWLGMSATSFEPLSVVRTPHTSIVYSVLYSMVDMDGDGFISAFEDRDCDEWDSAIYSSAYDVPGNGIDENCDGEDSSVTAAIGLFGNPEPFALDEARQFNVVVILIDALRADHVRTYGYSRDTTPNLDALARKSMVFLDAVSQYPSTGMSVPSILSGRYPSSLEWLPPRKRNEYPLAPSNRLVTDILRESGYYTGAILSNWLPKHIIGLSDHFDYMRTLGDSEEWRQLALSSSPISTAAAIDFLNHRPKGKPFFLLLHYADPHVPYVNHGSPGKIFGSRPMDRYDSDVFWADLWMGLFLSYLGHVDLTEDTVVIVLSDHGEEFSDHGMTHHGRQLYQESLHVPLIMHVPGNVEGQMVNERVGLIDVVPGILDITGTEVDRSGLHGTSLFRTAAYPGENPRPLFAALADRERAKPRRGYAVWYGALKLMSYSDSDEYELYDLFEDGREKNNVFDSSIEEHIMLEALITEFAATAHPSWANF